MVVVITDGPSNAGIELLIPESRALHLSGTTVVTVAVQHTGSSRVLEKITSAPVSENLFYVEPYDRLPEIRDRILDPVCSGKSSVTLIVWDCNREVNQKNYWLKRPRNKVIIIKDETLNTLRKSTDY